MNLKLCSIYDKRALNFGAPMAFPTLGVAERSFRDAAQQEKTMQKHPEDFTLYFIGDYDAETGKITQAEKHTMIIDGLDLPKLDGV